MLMNNTTNLSNIAQQTPLIKPSELLNALPLDSHLIKAIHEARRIITAIISGQDSRLLVIAGPCSLHDEQAALEYATLLKHAAAQYKNELYIIMRGYFAKPRTAKGWKGYVYDPLLDGSHDIEQGLLLTRKLLISINQLLPAACEFLDIFTPYYLQDLISWCAIGARTSASQLHRELASGLAMPVGFKNSVDGNIQIAIDAARSASAEHHYFGLSHEGLPAIIQTTGNKASHVILRGSLQAPNYSATDINNTSQTLLSMGLESRLIVDCSHDNCRKQYEQQIDVINELTQHMHPALCGVMIESNLVGGSQSIAHPKSLIYGQSITDPCLSWQDTKPLLEKLAMAVRKR